MIIDAVFKEEQSLKANFGVVLKGDKGDKGDIATLVFTDDGNGNVIVSADGAKVVPTTDGNGNIKLEVM